MNASDVDVLAANVPNPNPRPWINSNLLRWSTRIGGGLTIRYRLNARRMMYRFLDFFLVNFGRASSPSATGAEDTLELASPSSEDASNDPAEDASE